MALSKRAKLHLIATGITETEQRFRRLGVVIKTVETNTRDVARAFGFMAITGRQSMAAMIGAMGDARDNMRALQAQGLVTARALFASFSVAGAAAAKAGGPVRGVRAPGGGIGAGAAGLGVGSLAGGALGVGATAAAAGVGLFGALRRGEQIQGVSEGFGRLSGGAEKATATLDRLRAATGRGVTDFELMVGANRLLAAQLGLTDQQMGKLFAGSVRLGRALGIDASQAVERLSLALAKQEPELLDELGIKVDLTKAVSEYARANNVTVESINAQQRAVIFTNAVMVQMNERTKEIGGTADLTATKADRLSVVWRQMGDNFAKTVNASAGVEIAFTKVGEKAGAAAEGVGKLVAALGKVIEKYDALVKKTQEFNASVLGEDRARRLEAAGQKVADRSSIPGLVWDVFTG